VRHSFLLISTDIYQSFSNLRARSNLRYLYYFKVWFTDWLFLLQGFLSVRPSTDLGRTGALQASFYVYCCIWGLLMKLWRVYRGGSSSIRFIILMHVTVPDCAPLLLELSQMAQWLNIIIFCTFGRKLSLLRVILGNLSLSSRLFLILFIIFYYIYDCGLLFCSFSAVIDRVLWELNFNRLRKIKIWFFLGRQRVRRSQNFDGWCCEIRLNHRWWLEHFHFLQFSLLIGFIFFIWIHITVAMWLTPLTFNLEIDSQRSIQIPLWKAIITFIVLYELKLLHGSRM